MAGGDARAATEHDLGRRTPLQQAFEVGAQFARIAEPALRHVPAIGPVERARDMARHRIQRFGLAAETLRRPRVDQPSGRRRKTREHLVGADHLVQVEFALVVAGAPRGFAGFQRQPELAPAGETAIEYRDAPVSEQAQQPPETRGGHRAVAGVVGHDLVEHARQPGTVELKQELAHTRTTLSSGGSHLLETYEGRAPTAGRPS